MPKYIYVARDKTGKKVTAVQEAANEEAVIAHLQSMDMLVVNVLPASEAGMDMVLSETKGRVGFKVKKHHGVSTTDLVLFCRQLTTLLSAGVTILKSLDTISRQISSQKLYLVMEGLKRNMEQGLSFHEALAKHPEVFSDLWVNLVESGEASGNLAVVLDRLAMYLERNEEFKKKMISALIYPAILLLGSIGALLFLTIKIVPTFAEVFKGMSIEMPTPTLILIAVSNFIRKYFLVMIIGMVAAGFILRSYIKTKEGRRQYENLLFSLPVFGEFFRALTIEKFASEMSTLIESGVPILYALEITEQSVGSLIVGDIVRKVKEDVRAGKPLSQPLEKSGFFEPMVVQMVNIGEEIGELSPMFKRINVFYQSYVETFLARIISMFEPLILIVMGAVIGLMVVGMFLPMFQLTKVTGG